MVPWRPSAERILHCECSTRYMRLPKPAPMLGSHKLLAMSALISWGCPGLAMIALMAAGYACMLAWQQFFMPLCWTCAYALLSFKTKIVGFRVSLPCYRHPSNSCCKMHDASSCNTAVSYI